MVFEVESEMAHFKRNPQWRAESITVTEHLNNAWSGSEATQIQAEKDDRNMTEEDQDELIAAADPSRIPPKTYLRIPRCLEAIEKEINDLVKRDKKGIPSLVAVRLDDKSYMGLPRTHATLVVKQKNTKVMKARLCVRGGEIHGMSEFDTSAPTATRLSSKVVMFVSTVMKWSLGVVDISQAFLQADLITPAQRIIVHPPWFVPMPWQGRVDVQLPRNSKPVWGFLTMRPLYGTKCAPLRWYQKLTACFLSHNWNPCTLDPCIYRRTLNGILQGLAVLHVDDILITATDFGLKSFNLVIDSFQHTGVIFLSSQNPILYL